MKSKVIVTENFEREAKRLIKKFKSLKKEIQELGKTLEDNPTEGILIKEQTYKIRLAVKSKGKGKSGGMRIITYLVETTETDTIVYLLSIYDKSDLSNISDARMKQLIEEVHEELPPKEEKIELDKKENENLNEDEKNNESEQK